MADFFEGWRWRFAIHAMLLLVAGGIAGCDYFRVLRHDDRPPCDTSEERWCVLGEVPACASDHPCLTDTIVEHRWRSAHQEGLLHGLLLLGFAAAAPYLRVGRLVFTFAGWLLILGAWTASAGVIVQAWAAEHSQGPLTWCPVTKVESPAYECVGLLLGAYAGPITGIAFALVAVRSLWEVLRDGIAPATWRNWSWTVRARPRWIASPQNLPGLLASVQAALDDQLCVRAFGSRYSWSAIAPTDDVMIDMRQLHAIGQVGPPPPNPVDPATTHSITVEAGATIREVTDALAGFVSPQAPNGLMLATTPVNPWIQVGGALALGCHGTGIGVPPFFELVSQIEIVQYQPGMQIAFLNAVERPGLGAGAAALAEWNALLVSLGSLGILYRVTFECRPLYNVLIQDTEFQMAGTIGNNLALANIVNSNQFAEIFWYPFNNTCFVRSWNEIANAANGFSRWFWIWQRVVARLGDVVLFLVLWLVPFVTPWLSRRFNDWFTHLNHIVPAPDAMQYERHYPHVYDMGYAIPIDPDNAANPAGFAAFQNAWFAAVNRIESARARGEYPQNLPIHARFGRPSHALLAPNQAGPMPAYAFIEILTHVHTGGHEAHFRDVERAWRGLGGNSHWGKVTSDPARLADNYPVAALNQFLAVRAQMDPSRVFLNDFVRDALGL